MADIIPNDPRLASLLAFLAKHPNAGVTLSAEDDVIEIPPPPPESKRPRAAEKMSEIDHLGEALKKSEATVAYYRAQMEQFNKKSDARECAESSAATMEEAKPEAAIAEETPPEAEVEAEVEAATAEAATPEETPPEAAAAGESETPPETEVTEETLSEAHNETEERKGEQAADESGPGGEVVSITSSAKKRKRDEAARLSEWSVADAKPIIIAKQNVEEATKTPVRSYQPKRRKVTAALHDIIAKLKEADERNEVTLKLPSVDASSLIYRYIREAPATKLVSYIPSVTKYIMHAHVHQMMGYYYLSIIAHRLKEENAGEYNKMAAIPGMKSPNYQAALPRFYKFVNDNYDTGDSANDLAEILIFRADIKWTEWMKLLQDAHIHLLQEALDIVHPVETPSGATIEEVNDEE